jgi:hypothetical protein
VEKGKSPANDSQRVALTCSGFMNIEHSIDHIDSIT